MQRRSLLVVEIIAAIGENQLELGALGKISRLIENDATIADLSLERVRTPSRLRSPTTSTKARLDPRRVALRNVDRISSSRRLWL